MFLFCPWLPLLGTLALCVPTVPDLKITLRHTSWGLSWETTTYIKADRRRSEYRNQQGSVVGPRLANITRCDLGQTFELNLDSREYKSGPLQKLPTREELKALAAKAPGPAEPPKPTFIVETTTVDTGERKQLFGFAARHVLTTRKEVPLEGSGREPNKQVKDGWYIDLDTRISCDPHYPSSGHAFLSVSSGKPEIPDFKDIGKPETGYSLELMSRTIIPPNRKIQGHTSSVEEKIIELSTTSLDASLFEVPPGFKKVDRIARDPEPPLPIKLRSAWEYWKYRLLNLFR